MRFHLLSKEKHDIVKQNLRTSLWACIIYLDLMPLHCWQSPRMSDAWLAKPVQDRDGNIHNNMRKLKRKSWYFFSRTLTYWRTSSHHKGGSVIVSSVSRMFKKKSQRTSWETLQTFWGDSTKNKMNGSNTVSNWQVLSWWQRKTCLSIKRRPHWNTDLHEPPPGGKRRPPAGSSARPG